MPPGVALVAAGTIVTDDLWFHLAAGRAYATRAPCSAPVQGVDRAFRLQEQRRSDARGCASTPGEPINLAKTSINETGSATLAPAAGIRVIGNCMFGLAEDDPERMQATLDLSLDLNYVWLSVFDTGSPRGSSTSPNTFGAKPMTDGLFGT